MEIEVVRKLRNGYAVMRAETPDYVDVQLVASSGLRFGQPISIRKPHVDPVTRKSRTAMINWFSGNKTEWEAALFLKALEIAVDEARLLNEAFLSENSFKR